MAGDRWAEAQRLHGTAAAEYMGAAQAVPAALWSVPREPGKWSPAEITEHLNLAYEVLLRELAGGSGMALRTRWWQRLVLHVGWRRRLLAGAAFPPGVPAPREVRPVPREETQVEAVARFRALGEAFSAAMEEARRTQPRKRLTHAYFGARPLPEALRFCAVHVRHHLRQLPAALPAPDQPA